MADLVPEFLDRTGPGRRNNLLIAIVDKIQDRSWIPGAAVVGGTKGSEIRAHVEKDAGRGLGVAAIGIQGTAPAIAISVSIPPFAAGPVRMSGRLGFGITHGGKQQNQTGDDFPDVHDFSPELVFPGTENLNSPRLRLQGAPWRPCA
jgi:hypothetical protein